MALRLDKSEELVRIRTQHVGDTTRLTQVILRSLLNAAYKRCRTELQTIAPSWGLNKTAELNVATGAQIDLTVSATNFEHLQRLETKAYSVDGASVAFTRWLKVARAGDTDTDLQKSAPIEFELRGTDIVFHPEGLCSGTFRALYHFTPSDLSADADTYVIPAAAEEWFKLLACREVALFDRNERQTKYWEELAEKQKEADRWNISRQYGSHGDGSGVPE